MPTVAGAGRRERVANVLGLEPNIVAVSTAMFLLGCGEQLWRRFLPKYLESFGAPITAIGLFGTAEDFLDGVYQYPGGWIADRYGRRRALLAFVALALIMAWDSMASPTLFAVVGDALPSHKRTMGFTVQSTLRRVPIVVAPTLGGLAVAAFGVRGGVRLGLFVSVGTAAVTLAVASRVRIPVVPDQSPVTVRHVWASFPTPLRWLLASDVFVRTCEGMVDVFLVLYAVNVVGIGAPRFGALVAVQALSAILVYVPAARISQRTGKKPFVMPSVRALSRSASLTRRRAPSTA